MDVAVFQDLLQKGLIDENALNRVKEHELEKPVSVRWELKTILYGGILLLAGGLGIIIYKNIDSIGHLAIVTFIALTSIGCYLYCFLNASKYSNQKVNTPGLLFDYVLLLGCLLMTTFISYIQFQYNVFGHRWGLAAFVPMVILFFCAYYFDHLGVLSLAISALAAWVGLTISPLEIISSSRVVTPQLIYSGLLLGATLIIISIFSSKQQIKPHFAFSYKNYGVHMLFIASVAAIFYFENTYLVWFLLLCGISAYHWWTAVKERSFYFFVVATLYLYVGMSYVVILSVGDIFPILIYLIASAVALVILLIRVNKRLKKI